MKKSYLFLKAFLIILSIVLIFPLNTTGQQSTAKKSNNSKEQSSKIAYKNYMLIEGENAIDTNFSKEKTYNFFCSNKFALQLSKDADPKSEKGYYATYIFYAPGTKKYDFWMGCTPPGSTSADKPGYASPFEWKIDDGDFRKASSENTYVKEFYAPGSFYWTKITNGQLTAGRHTLTIRVNQKRSSGWDYYFYIDAIILIPEYSNYLIPLMSFPETFPKDFSDKGQGIKFLSVDDYKNRIKKNPRDRESVFALLQIYTWLYEYDKSIDLCKSYLKNNPKDIEMRLILASSLAWSNKLDEAIREYNNIISIDKKNITARKLLAVLAGWNNRYDEAIKNYQEIISIDKRNIDAYISLATQYSWKGEVNKALETFKNAESIAPNNIEVLYALGDNYTWTGKTYEATQQYKRIISLNEKEIEAYKKLARIYSETGQEKSAKEILEEASRITRIYPELSGISLDIESEMDADKLATIEEYKKALIRNPDDLETRKNLIDSYIWNKMDDNANAEYNNLLNLKVVSSMNQADEKVSALAVEAIKFKISEPLINNIRNEIKKLHEIYKNAESSISKGKPPKELTDSKIKNDFLITADYLKKIDLLETNISRFNDVISYYDKDIQSYITQKNALKWELNKKRILNQAYLSEKNSPDDYRPKKVIGTIEYLKNDAAIASQKMEFVYKNASAKSFPIYPLALTEQKKYREAEIIIDNIIKNKSLKGGINENLEQLQNFIKALGAKPLPETSTENKETLIKEINRLSSEGIKRLEEILQEKDEKLITVKTMVKQIFEKSLLDMENDNVPIYNEIANYHLNRGNKEVLDYYNRILEVQPLNVEINYKLGAQNEYLGYWKSAMENYEICINNEPDNQLARKAHYELQKEHALSVKDEFSFFEEMSGKEKKVTKINNLLSTEYPLNNWLKLGAGYAFRQIDDKGDTAQGDSKTADTKGLFTRNSANANLEINVLPISTRIMLTFTGHYYDGEIDYSDSNPNDGIVMDLFDSEINYYSLNYSAALFLPRFFNSLQLSLFYAFEDEAELTQSLKTESVDAITSNTLQGIADFTFSDFNFPLSDRIFMYDNFAYKMLSDDNTRTSNLYQLTFRLLRIPSYGIDFDINAKSTYEGTKFIKYSDPKNTEITSMPYYAPESIISYGGGFTWTQSIDNILKGKFSYQLSFQYTYEDVNASVNPYTQAGWSPGIKIMHEWDKINYYAGYQYSTSKASTEDAKVYESHLIEFGVQGKFFSAYSPKGLGGSNIAFATANPNIITADGDGKDDFTTFSLTAFDETGIKSWELEILDSTEEKVKSFSGTGNPPSTVKWDGTDKAYDPLPQDVYYYQLVINNTAGEKNISRKERIFLSTRTRAINPELSSPVFSPNGDGNKDKINIEFKATDKDMVASWNLFVMEKEQPKKDEKDEKKKRRQIFRTMNGYEFLPYDVEWDGKDDKGNILPDGEYNLSIKVKYEDKQEINSPEITVSIITKAPIKIKSNTNSIIPQKDMVRITPESGNKDLASWKLSFYSYDDKLLKMIHGSGRLPATIVWNGTDENDNVAGFNMPVTAVMEIMDTAGNKGLSNKETVWLDFLTEKEKDFTLITVFDQGIMHKRKEEKLTDTGMEIAKRLIDELKKYRNSKKIRVLGHTSSEGSGDKNIELSKNRARTLGQMIKDGLGLETGIVNINGMGETTPYAKFDNRKWDNRYEIEIY